MEPRWSREPFFDSTYKNREREESKEDSVRRLQCRVQPQHPLHHRACALVVLHTTLAHMVSSHRYKLCSQSNLRRRMTIGMSKAYQDNNDLAGKEAGVSRLTLMNSQPWNYHKRENREHLFVLLKQNTWCGIATLKDIVVLCLDNLHDPN